MKILSLFDGMACAMLALNKSNVKVDEYTAFEIDKYAIQSAVHNFPIISEQGDVFSADFTQYVGVDFLFGGSPCTYWSIAQNPDTRETKASGLGWDLFSQYVRALHEAKPKFFIYENNKSMSKQIHDSICEAFGFDEVFINSSLVSAQNRQRYYWVGKRNDDGTYSKVNVDLPADSGILLKDILQSGMTWLDKSYAYTTRCHSACLHDTLRRCRHTMVAEPVGITKDGKAFCLSQNYYKGSSLQHTLEKKTKSLVAEKIPSELLHVCMEKVHEVKDGIILIQGEPVKIDLPDGNYIFRKLSILEAMRLQTVPETYEFPVSTTQAYRQLGNGWTISVISILIDCCLKNKN